MDRAVSCPVQIPWRVPIRLAKWHVKDHHVQWIAAQCNLSVLMHAVSPWNVTGMFMYVCMYMRICDRFWPHDFYHVHLASGNSLAALTLSLYRHSAPAWRVILKHDDMYQNLTTATWKQTYKILLMSKFDMKRKQIHITWWDSDRNQTRVN